MTKQAPLKGRARGKLPFAPEGWPFLIPTALLFFIALALCWSVAAAVLGVLLAFMLNFFRDPERPTPTDAGLFVAPADGKVVRAERVDGVQRVDIFMNVFDVHVNRAPMSGRITHMQYTPGSFGNAAFDNASRENERNRFEMETDDGQRIAFTQIAGLVARRIVAYAAVGDRVEVGERIGMIRFGSRVDCEIPDGFEICVQAGEKVTAGLTVIARKRAEGDDGQA